MMDGWMYDVCDTVINRRATKKNPQQLFDGTAFLNKIFFYLETTENDMKIMERVICAFSTYLD